MKVLVFEQWQGGHYDNYLQCLLPKLATLAGQVEVAVTRAAFDAPRGVARQAAIAALPNVRFVPCVPPLAPRLPPKDRLRAARHLADAMRTLRPDYTLVPSADAQSWGLAAQRLLGRDVLAGLGPVEATFHTGYGPGLHTTKQRLKEFAYGRIYRALHLPRMNFVNFNYYEYLQRSPLGKRAELALVGDPVPALAPIGRDAACRLLGLDASARHIGLLGSLDRRKAVPELLAAFRAARLAPRDRLVLAGRLAAPYAALIKDRYADLLADGRLVVIDRFLTTEELAHGYEALDLATPVYYDFPGAASLAMKALAAGRPILVGDLGWSRSLVRRFGVGRCVRIMDAEDFARTLPQALDEAAGYRGGGEAVARLLEFHSPDNFTGNMLEGVSRHAGVPTPRATPRRDWSWVLEALPPERRHLH